MSSLVDLLNSNDYDGLASFCEKTELLAPLGVASPEIYGTLLSVYLLQNELDHAKLLWKRIPGSIKGSNPEIPCVWEVGKRLWRREFSEVYPLIEQRQWPQNIAPILYQLRDNVRQRVVGLIGKAYTAISLDQVCQLLGSDQQNALAILKDKDWRVNDNTVYPIQDHRTVIVHNEGITSQERLTELVDIVSFLEN